MYSVTQRIKMVKNDYISSKDFSEFSFSDGYEVKEVIPTVKAIQGLAVDYLTRYLMGCSKEAAFSVSLHGAEWVSERENAQKLLQQIKGLDIFSIRSACQLVQYDVARRQGPQAFDGIRKDILSIQLFLNISHMVKRSCSFLKANGPVCMCGFTMEGGYNDIISSGDGDYVTKNAIWDFKVSTDKLTSLQALQLAVYYVMGVHSVHPEFQTVRFLGIYNPFLNKAYSIDISKIDNSVFSAICRDVIGYNTPDDVDRWRESSGTNHCILEALFPKTDFRPENYEDGIHDISIDDYWSYYSTIAEVMGKPTFRWTECIKFLKNQGFYMFISISPQNKLSVLKGGAYKRLRHSIDYYYERMPEYGNLILNKFSDYWKAIYRISEQIKTISPDKSVVKMHQFKEFVEQYHNWQLPALPFDEWYKTYGESLQFDGRVHGCIVDFTYTDHAFLNPFDGTIAAYSAPTPDEKYVFDNVASLISTKRPDMLEGYRKLSEDKSNILSLTAGNAESTHALITVDRNVMMRIIQKGIIGSEDDEISEKITLVLDREMYKISSIFIELQRIYDHHLIVVWHDFLLPHYELEGEVSVRKKSIENKTALMRCGMNATVILDNGFKDITVKFDDGTVIEHATRAQFRSRTIKNPNLSNKRQRL